MSQATSATTGRRYGLKRVCRTWERSRSALLRAAGAFAAPSAGHWSSAPRADARAVGHAVAGGHSQ